ncbi:hypothetical protein D3C85_1575410 [compost metagenome]
MDQEVVTKLIELKLEQIMAGLQLHTESNMVVRKLEKVLHKKMEWNNQFIIGIL